MRTTLLQGAGAMAIMVWVMLTGKSLGLPYAAASALSGMCIILMATVYDMIMKGDYHEQEGAETTADEEGTGAHE